MFALYHIDHGSVPGIGISPDCWMAQIVLWEKSIGHSRVLLDMARGDLERAEFLEFHPRARLPLLIEGRGQIDEVRMWEPLAILQYLDYRVERPSLLPTGPQRGAALQALHAAAELGRIVAGMRADLAGPGHDPRAAFENRRAFDRCLEHWERGLTHAPWAGGEHFGLADVVLLAQMTCAARLGHTWSKHRHLADHHDRMWQRESVRSTAPAGLLEGGA